MKINCEKGRFHYNDEIEHYVTATNEIFWNNQSLKLCDNCLIEFKKNIKKIDKIEERLNGWIRELKSYNANDLPLTVITKKEVGD